MPVLSCYVDDRTLAILRRISPEKGMTVEQLAEAAIENAAIAELPGGLPGSGQHFAYDGSEIDTRTIGSADDPGIRGDRHHRAQVDRLGGQPFHHGLAADDAEKLKGWIGDELRRDRLGNTFENGATLSDDPELGRECSIRPGFYEGDME